MALSGMFVGKAIAAGRVAYGIGCMAAPRKLMGPAGARAEGQMIWMTRAFGVRDLILGSGTLLALGESASAGARWVELSALADALDVANAGLFRKELDRTGVIATLSLAVPATLGGAYAAKQLRSQAS